MYEFQMPHQGFVQRRGQCRGFSVLVVLTASGEYHQGKRAVKIGHLAYLRLRQSSGH